MIGKHFLRILFLAPAIAAGQTPYSLVQGTVHDGIGGRPVEGARVAYVRAGSDTSGFACTDAKGRFSLPGLSPGTIQLSVRHVGAGCLTGVAAVDSRKWRETDLEVSVAGRTDLRIVLWPMSDVWSERVFEGVRFAESRSLAHAYGPDLDTSRSENFTPIPTDGALLDSALSNVTGSRLVRDLPLAGRDIYTTLVLQPGVTSDAGAARGLGVSVTGQRATSANYLVDGVEMNNPLLSGPLLSIAPEAVQEYRYSTNGFAAEYGRAAGVVANAVTRSGGSAWHGLGYFYGKHDLLSANEWQRNATGQDRQPLREIQPGASIGGPVLRGLFASVSGEALRFRSTGAYETFALPGKDAITVAGPRARGYLEGSGLPQYASNGATTPVTVRLEPRVTLDRTLLLPRLDLISRDERHRTFVRFAYSRLDRPDLIWTPYLADRVPFQERAANLAVSHTAAIIPTLLAELRAAVSGHSYSVVRPRQGIPFFSNIYISDDASLLLPGSPIAYDFAQRERTLQTTGAISWTRGAHLFKAGFDTMLRRADNRASTFQDGSVIFGAFTDFLRDRRPLLTESAVGCRDVTRFNCAGAQPAPRRDLVIAEPAWYAQATIRISEHMVAHGGVRIEIMGAPRAAETSPVYSFDRPPANASDIAALRVAASDRPFASLRAISARTGLAYSWGAVRRSTLRLGYGAFQDRLIESIWFGARRGETALDGPSAIAITAFDARFRPGVAHDSFAALQTAVSDAWTLEATGQIASGRALPSANLVNRESTIRRPGVFPYVGNQSESFYSAFTATLRGRTARSQFQAAYTWSHSTDYQSDALQGYFGSIFSNPNAPPEVEASRATFMRQFTREGEWASSDFDQRHNLVLHGSWEPRPGWTVAGLMAARTGFPFSVLAATGQRNDGLRKARAAVKTSDPAAYARRTAADGGYSILDASQFTRALQGIGATGRNAFAGPGLFAADLSLSRRWRRVTLRADVFNALNHANLNRPTAALGADDFGVAKVGKREQDTGFPALLPLVESPRRVQILLRYEF